MRLLFDFGAPLRVYVEPLAYTLFLCKKIGIHCFIWKKQFLVYNGYKIRTL